MEERLEGFLTTQQASKRVGMHHSHLRRLLEHGKVKGIKMGHDWLVDAASIDYYAAHCGRPERRGPKKKDEQNK